MKVAGCDHDMLLVAHVLRLYGRDVEAQAARATGMDESVNDTALSAETLADILVYAELPALILSEKTPDLTRLASEYAGQGAAVFAQMVCPDIGPDPMWHLVSSGHDGYFATLCLVERPKPPIVGGPVGQAMRGGLVIVPVRCPAWRGSWDRLLPD